MYEWNKIQKSPLTLSVIGHCEIGVSIDAKGFPVPGAVGPKGLVGHKALPLLTPLVNDRKLLFGLFLSQLLGPTARVRHYKKRLQWIKKGKQMIRVWSMNNVILPHGSICFTSFCIFPNPFPLRSVLQPRYLFAQGEISPRQSSIGADTLVELETWLGP